LGSLSTLLRLEQLSRGWAHQVQSAKSRCPAPPNLSFDRNGDAKKNLQGER